MRLILPIGAMYWDTYIYFDAAQRIYNGQIPNTDFLTPVGPLDYYLFALGLKFFPNAQPLLLAQWVILLVAAPLMAAIIDDVARKERRIAFALLIPFLIFAICPANVQTFHSYPGLDGFGIYNRHATLLLYVLVSALMFVKDGRRLAILCGLTMLALFLIKVTGFLAGGLIGLLALLSGRISWRSVVLAGAIFLAALICLEFNGHMITAYIDEIALLIRMNEQALLPRFLTVLSTDLDIIMASGILVLALAWMGREKLLAGFSASAGIASTLLDSNFVWLAVALVAGIFFETQNTGSQDFTFLWPILLAIFIQSAHEPVSRRIAIVVLIGFVAIPYTTKIAHKTLRAVAVSPTYVAAPVTDMKTLGQVSTRWDIMERSLLMEKHYLEHGDTYSDLSSQGQLPSWQLYSELDYQMYWIISADEAVKAIRQFEATNGIHLATLMNLDFANPFPWLLDRDATRHIQIGADPYRTVPPLDDATRQSIAETDAVLVPHCPLTTGRRALRRIYADALKDRQEVKLNDCWDLLLRPGVLPSSS
ncbi:hypothetical protein C5748_02515 [Phyllobacterium phragmitis]|uniref:Glycosyltransferase RgtA/B/C/D-like domain-containing protein n=1 Tax=Phyllobacterium phragmitis TaxID=2670329 RepID=A0A2S9IXY3_9HYPH|nr:hypothetical protein [Phyllobacterium phragmitis]PRD45385.1 hypothetical protein C5748_02515 [Phyllobacterium phragmitis]